MIWYLIKFKPFKSELQQVINTGDEFIIVFGLILLYLLYRRQSDIEYWVKISWMIIAVVAFSLFKSVLIIVSIIIKTCYKKLKYWIRKKLDYQKWMKLKYKHNLKIKLEKKKKQQLYGALRTKSKQEDVKVQESSQLLRTREPLPMIKVWRPLAQSTAYDPSIPPTMINVPSLTNCKSKRTR